MRLFSLILRFIWSDVRTEATAAGYTIQLAEDEDVDVIFGSPISVCEYQKRDKIPNVGKYYPGSDYKRVSINLYLFVIIVIIANFSTALVAVVI